MNGDTIKALRAIKAKTLIMVGTKDLLNPEFEPIEAAHYIRDARVVTISPGTVTGHTSAGGGFPADVDFLNREISGFFDLLTDHGRKLHRAGAPGLWRGAMARHARRGVLTAATNQAG